MLSYLPDVAGASRKAEFPVTGTPAGTIVVRAADLLIRGGGAVAAGGAAPSAGEPAVFCRPVVTAPAAVRRDGTVLADAWLPDLVRLGELERHLGDAAIEAIAGRALEKGRLKRRQRRRLMSYPLVIRLMIAMALMPDASYCESLARLAGVLADIPFALEWHVPTEKVVTNWRVLVPADVMEGLFWQAAGPLISDDECWRPRCLHTTRLRSVLMSRQVLVRPPTVARAGGCEGRRGLAVLGAEQAGEGSDGLEQQRIDAFLLVGGAAGAELGDGAAVLGLGGELTDACGDGRADSCAASRG